MAIIKRAKNMTINVRGTHTLICDRLEIIAESITITSTEENLVLASNKKIIVEGKEGEVKFGEYIAPTESLIEANKLSVKRIFWKGRDSGTERKDLMLNHNIKLQIELLNYKEGDNINLTVKQNKGRRIQGDNTEFIISGIVESNGFVVINDFMVECDFKEDNQDFGMIEFYYDNEKIDEFQENFGWTYIKDNNITKIFVNLDLSIDYLAIGCLESDYKDSINSLFKKVLEKTSKGKITGKFFFQGITTQELPQVVPKLVISPKTKNEITVAGLTNNITSWVGSEVIDNSYLLTDLSDTSVHELLHTLRLYHPFELTQSMDTKLIKVGNNKYETTSDTDKNIYNNIMNYDSIEIDGIHLSDLWRKSPPQYLTEGQIKFMLQEIDLQRQGNGTLGMDFTDYWLDFPGENIIKKN